jgi:hypothetical protein
VSTRDWQHIPGQQQQNFFFKKKKKISAFSSLLEPFVGPLSVGPLFKSCGTVQKPGSCLPFDGFVLKLNTQASLLSFLIFGIEVMF